SAVSGSRLVTGRYNNVVRLSKQNVTCVQHQTRRSLNIDGTPDELLRGDSQFIQTRRSLRIFITQRFRVQTWNVEGTFIPGFHHLLANQCHVDVARSLPLRIERRAVFVSFVCNHTSSHYNTSALRKSLLKLAIESDEKTLITTERQRNYS